MFSREKAKPKATKLRWVTATRSACADFLPIVKVAVWRNSTRKSATCSPPYRSKQVALKGPVSEWDKAIDSQGSRFIFRKAINVLQPETDAGILHLPPIPA